MTFSAGVPSASADVYVLTNRQAQTVHFNVPTLAQFGEDESYELPAGRSVAIRGFGGRVFTYQSDVGPVRVELLPNSVYAFEMTSDSRLLLKQVELGESSETIAGTGSVNATEIYRTIDLPVKILVDDEERAARKIWETRLRRRVEAASRVLEQAFLIRLEIVAVETWQSDNRLTTFPDALQEFTQAVDPAPARIAIGFSSQFSIPREPGRIGLTSGLMGGHILMKELSQDATEAELTEALLHELGRMLGGVHQNANTSIMRERLLDGQARDANFPLQYDPVNLLLINMFTEEMRRNNVQRIADLQPATRTRLKQVYRKLGYGPKPATVAKENPPASEKGTTELADSSPAAASPKELPAETPSPAKRTTPHPDLKKLQGKWKVIAAERRGQKVPEALLYKPRLEEDQLTLSAQQLGTFRFRMDIDPQDKTIASNYVGPIPFDLVMTIQNKSYVAQGIYEYDGVELRVCCARPGNPRPTKFAAPADRDQALLVFRRDAE